MFKNLQAEMVRKGMSYKELASTIEMRYETFSKKMSGKSEFHLSEMENIKKVIGNDYTFEYLFEKSEQ